MGACGLHWRAETDGDREEDGGKVGKALVVALVRSPW